ncbi:MAG: hypothetical protein OT477_14840 [Chloroflexi bacterium]|nr:hypothetical protein [Chloroflexota bacterium]
MGTKTYKNKARITLSGGADKGKTFEVGEYEGALDHLTEGQIALLLRKGVIQEVSAAKPAVKVVKDGPNT